MSFDEEMEPIFDGIKSAAEAAGLEAKRVKDVIGDYNPYQDDKRSVHSSSRSNS